MKYEEFSMFNYKYSYEESPNEPRNLVFGSGLSYFSFLTQDQGQIVSSRRANSKWKVQNEKLGMSCEYQYEVVKSHNS